MCAHTLWDLVKEKENIHKKKKGQKLGWVYQTRVFQLNSQMESQEIDQELGLGLSDSPFKESQSYIFPYQSSDNCMEKTRVF